MMLWQPGQGKPAMVMVIGIDAGNIAAQNSLDSERGHSASCSIANTTISECIMQCYGKCIHWLLGFVAWLSLASVLPAAEEPVAIKQRPYQVGFRRIDFRFTTPAGDECRRRLDLWYPTEQQESPYNYRAQQGFAAKDAKVAPGRHPLLLFSHGYLGVSDQSIFITEACARAGYIVASMNHQDALVNIFQPGQDPPKFAEFAKWTDAKYRDRHDDIVALVDYLLELNGTKDSPLQDRIDPKLIGGVGHSLGGYTMLGLAGGWKSWHEPRIKALVLFSPLAQPYAVNGKLNNVSIPVMIQGGTFDIPITPFLPAVYDKLGGPRTFLVLKNETHFGWTNLVSLGKTTKETVAAGNPELMMRYCIAYFDQHLLGSDQAKILEARDPALESYRFSNQR